MATTNDNKVFIPMGHSMSKTIIKSYNWGAVFLSPWVIQCQRLILDRNKIHRGIVFLSPWVIQCQRLERFLHHF